LTTARGNTVQFGEKAKTLMDEQGVSLRELARRTHYDAGHLSKVLKGYKPASTELAARLDAALDADGSLLALANERVAEAAEAPRRVDDAVLEAVAGMLAATRRLEDATSSATVLPAVREYLAMVDRFARDSEAARRPATVGLLSELYQYAGWLYIPMRRWSDSERSLDRAVVLGMEAGDPQRTATALSFGAYGAMRRGDTRRASALNDAASRDTSVAPGLRAYIVHQGAEILAGDDNAEARRLLHEAEKLADQLNPDELTDSGYWYTPEFFAGTRAFILAKLGEHERARELMAESLAALPPEWRDSEWAERRRAFLAA
jgi:transcriptional regulator with XRE-family HTH domain